MNRCSIRSRWALDDEQHAVRNLKTLPGYAAAFKQAFPADETALSFANILIALGAYQPTLIAPAPWDHYVAGQEDAVPVNAKRGFVLFEHQKDQGRFESTKLEADKMRFRVPSLRNVAMTAPYFHDGSAQTLREAVAMMAKYQLGKTLDPADVDSIVEYLKALTGELPKEAIDASKLAAHAL